MNKGALAAITVFLLVSIPLTTYLVLNSESASREPQAATVCEKDCDEATTTSNTTEIKEDLNKDGLVNGSDLAIVLTAFGKTGDNEADLNGDNIVNESDVTLVKAKWSK
jgi:hypothetical protein